MQLLSCGKIVHNLRKAIIIHHAVFVNTQNCLQGRGREVLTCRMGNANLCGGFSLFLPNVNVFCFVKVMFISFLVQNHLCFQNFAVARLTANFPCCKATEKVGSLLKKPFVGKQSTCYISIDTNGFVW